MSLNPMAKFQSWNFSNATKDTYTKPDENGNQVFIGTVVSIQEVQARDYSTTPGKLGKPRTWDNGDPVLNIRMGFADPDGNIITFTFPEAGKEQKLRKKPSVHMTMYDLSGGNMKNLIGKTLQIITWPANPQTGQAWGKGNPRLFDVQEVDAGPFQAKDDIPNELTVDVLLCNDGASGGQTVQQQQQPVYAQPTYQQPVYQPQPIVQPMPVQPIQPQQYPTMQTTGINQMANGPVMAQAQPVMPNGMNPQIAAQMQTMGAVNVQPVVENNDPYDDQNIPF